MEPVAGNRVIVPGRDAFIGRGGERSCGTAWGESLGSSGEYRESSARATARVAVASGHYARQWSDGAPVAAGKGRLVGRLRRRPEHSGPSCREVAPEAVTRGRCCGRGRNMNQPHDRGAPSRHASFVRPHRRRAQKHVAARSCCCISRRRAARAIASYAAPRT